MKAWTIKTEDYLLGAAECAKMGLKCGVPQNQLFEFVRASYNANDEGPLTDFQIRKLVEDVVNESS